MPNNGYNSLFHLVKIKISKFNTADFISGMFPAENPTTKP